MVKGKQEKQTYCSVEEIERKYFPNSFNRKRTPNNIDVESVGIISAKQSLDRIRKTLAKIN